MLRRPIRRSRARPDVVLVRVIPCRLIGVVVMSCHQFDDVYRGRLLKAGCDRKMVVLSLPATEQITGNRPQNRLDELVLLTARGRRLGNHPENTLPNQRLKRVVDLSFRGSGDGAYRVAAERGTEYGQAFDKVSLRRWQSVQPGGYQRDQ